MRALKAVGIAIVFVAAFLAVLGVIAVLMALLQSALQSNGIDPESAGLLSSGIFALTLVGLLVFIVAYFELG